MESNEDSLAKVAMYQTQLEQIQSFLRTDPNNEQFLQLQEDLIKAIALTNHLIQAQNNSGNENDDVDEDSGDDEDDNEDQTFVKAVLPSKTGDLHPGEVVEVISNDRPYAGYIASIDRAQDTCVVRYFEYPDTDVPLPLSSVSRVPPGVYTRDEINIGFVGMCKYSQDQKYYKMEVKEVLAHGYVVTYTEYGNSEQVPIEYIRPLNQSDKVKKSKSEKNELLPNEKGIIPVPDKLKILPSDTEEEKARKKKKLKAIKNHNRKVTRSQEMQVQQQSWQKFVNKGTKRAITGLSKTSIFATSDEVGGKVGVVNSGKGLTDFTQRKKHQFNSL